MFKKIKTAGEIVTWGLVAVNTVRGIHGLAQGIIDHYKYRPSKK